MEHGWRLLSLSNLCTHNSADHSWSCNTKALVKKVQQWLPFMHYKNKAAAGLPFYCGECAHIMSVCVVFRLRSRGKEVCAEDDEHCQKQPLPTLEHISTTYSLRKTNPITGDPSHTAHSCFEQSSSRRRFRSIRSHTNRLTNSFFPVPSELQILTDLHSHTHK